MTPLGISTKLGISIAVRIQTSVILLLLFAVLSAPYFHGQESGDAARVAAALEKALEVEPGLGSALYNLGLLYLEQVRKERARTLLLKYKDLYGSRLDERERVRLEELLGRTIKQL